MWRRYHFRQPYDGEPSGLCGVPQLREGFLLIRNRKMRSKNLIAILSFGFILSPAGSSGQVVRSAEAPVFSNKISDSYTLAARLADRREDAAALAMLRPLAEAGHAQAGLLLGRMYANGWGVPANRAEGLAWVRRAAAAADAEGQAYVALNFLFSDGFPGYDEAEALRWFRIAANRGSARAAFGLGLMYKHGRGVPRDHALAARWFRQAATGRLAPAELMLATLLADPASPLHNPTEAQRHFRAAATVGGVGLFRVWADAYDGGPSAFYPVPVDHVEAAMLRSRADALAVAN